MKDKITLITTNSSGSPTGLSRYSASLIDAYHKKGQSFLSSSLESHFNSSFISFLKSFFSIDIKSFFSQYPLWFPTLKTEIIHLTNQAQCIPLNYSRKKAIVTVHDIIPFILEREKPFYYSLIFYLMKRGIGKSCWIIADSEHTKNDLISTFQYPSERITVVPLGVNLDFFYDKKKKRDLFTILYVGSEMPRKNVELLFKAFSIVKKNFPEAKLVKVGKSQWPGARKKLETLSQTLGISDSILFYDKVEEEHISNLYNTATLFVHPSYYEGFGFPLLEAMACGCPSIVAKATSLPEIGGNAVLYFDPTDEKGLASQISTVFKEKTLQKKLSKKGLERAKHFTWENTAEKNLQVYKKVLSKLI
jgi:glycosyltransferase involved in cell wall biosynthesis